MKKKKKTLLINTLIYFIIFSVVLLLFLWIFQILSLNTLYKISRTKELNKAVISLTKEYDSKDFQDAFDEISINNDVCIEVIDKGVLAYVSKSPDRKCLTRKNIDIYRFETEFIENDESLKRAEIINPNFNNETLVIGKKLDDETFLFVNTSLVPLDTSIEMLKNQFIYIAIIILLMAAVVSYFISKQLSIPIARINEKAKRLGKKDYSTTFEENTNILELDELGSTLNETVRELSKTDELRRELMANVSHDLKTPLTLIRAYAEAAKDIDAGKKKKRDEDLNIIIDETSRLTLLVNDILELSRLEANVEELVLEPFNLRELIDTIIKKFDILKNDGFVFEVECPDIVMINSSRKKLEQVVYNLINNAINYTGDDKKVIIRVKLVNDAVRVEVIDTGAGIAPEELGLIWDKYYKIDKQRKRNKYGTGLGLSIVKSTLIALNYAYGVESQLGAGTTFYFEIK